MLKTLFRLGLGERLPLTHGTIVDAPVRAPVTVTRDAHGIPYIDATHAEDAFWAMGFCQAQDRAFQMELYLRVARGTLSALVGEEMLPVDRLMRRIGLRRIAERQL